MSTRGPETRFLRLVSLEPEQDAREIQLRAGHVRLEQALVLLHAALGGQQVLQRLVDDMDTRRNRHTPGLAIDDDLADLVALATERLHRRGGSRRCWCWRRCWCRSRRLRRGISHERAEQHDGDGD
jgi:hypothetical protein